MAVGNTRVLRVTFVEPTMVDFDEIRAAGKQDWRLDNTAMKSIRFQGESPPGTPLDRSGVDLTHSDPCPVLTVRRDKGARI